VFILRTSFLILQLYFTAQKGKTEQQENQKLLISNKL